jgi:hypothetical protein
MHPFGFIGEGFHQTGAATETLADLLCLGDQLCSLIFPLALAHQVVAGSAQKIATAPIELRHAMAASPAWALKPRALSAIMAASLQ